MPLALAVNFDTLSCSVIRGEREDLTPSEPSAFFSPEC
jgi:hypothetical protein